MPAGAPIPPKPSAFVFVMVLAMVVTLAITAWAGIEWAAPTETIYLPQHWNLF
jgi:hypothetical protein